MPLLASQVKFLSKYNARISGLSLHLRNVTVIVFLMLVCSFSFAKLSLQGRDLESQPFSE